MERCREKWIDRVKLFACVLVALGHFFQSMVAAEILPLTLIHEWFIETIYYFHVPLFFLCSGYLHQKYGVASFCEWKHTIAKKAIALGIPYFIFSLVTFVLKSIFANSVNSQNEGLLATLLLSPASPYWYLYTLFLIFIVTPVFSNQKTAIGILFAALILKVISITYGGSIGIYAVSSVAANEIWFVGGMLLNYLKIPNRQIIKNYASKSNIIMAILFVVVSVVVYVLPFKSNVLSMLMGCWGCMVTLMITFSVEHIDFMIDTLGQYSMPVFLMHTIFAAGLRAVLVKFGIINGALHVVLGVAISFIGPIVAIEVMRKLKLDFFVFPTKYVKFSKRNG